jgi:hypothetical protein
LNLDATIGCLSDSLNSRKQAYPDYNSRNLNHTTISHPERFIDIDDVYKDNTSFNFPIKSPNED